MRKLVYYSLITGIFLVFAACQNNRSSDEFTIDMTISGTPDTWVTLQQYDNGEWQKYDSAELKDGRAVLSGQTQMPEMFYVAFAGSRAFMPVFAEPGSLLVTAEFDNIRDPEVKGSESHQLYHEFSLSLKDIDGLFESLNQQYRQAKTDQDTERVQSITDSFNELEIRKADHIKSFALSHKGSVLSPYVMVSNSYMFDLEDLDEIASALEPEIEGSVYAQSLNERVNTLKKVSIGQPFTDFTLDDPDGNPISLSSVIGKNYVLVDFWASWCQPCRAENPNIVEAYQQYKERGFDVFGVSLDREHNSWVKAIHDDQLTWSHVSDLKFWGSEAGKLYGVQSIPHSVLISPEGLIVAKNLRGDELHEKLAEYLNN